MKTLAAIIVIEIIILSLQTCHLQVAVSDFQLRHPDECYAENKRQLPDWVFE